MNHKTESYLDKYPFYKRNASDTIYWVDVCDQKGLFLFSFDKIHVFNLFTDYPKSLTEEQKTIFDKENPFWADFFKEK